MIYNFFPLLNGFVLFGKVLLAQPSWLENITEPVNWVPLPGIALRREDHTTICGMLFYVFMLHRGDIPVKF